MTVSRIDYANGVYVTFEQMTPDSDGYDAGQRWYYVVWTPEAGSVDSGYEVEDCGYAETKRDAIKLAREARESVKRRRADNAARYYVFDRKVSPLTTYSAVNPRYWIVDRTTNRYVDECQTREAAKLAARTLNAAN